ncbi:unnamed protein product [Rotaria magnacalcarata]|uniref:EGF-like domain-containing protein n=1 Tax=Rotaria magnacalcarata TaxID=392030 RepID=A0A819GT39_9BILA|nr:unnamed protein product [Rotaria magnacalcarata]CAF2233602.1 unnamed protein product [Rotaria magnacalcarata]CAF3841262.1 unnamed protein product [Rotaria magnacalcarata]CAF3891622.1 unnamed protein product [Rotaria magnacalcarata]
MNSFVYSILCFVLIYIGSIQLETSSLCAGKNVTSQPVIDYCHSQHGYFIFRCCRSNDNVTFVAIDLMDHNYTQVPDFTQFTNLNLSVVDLRSNPELKPSKDNDFLTLTYLDQLFLPEHFSCPGEEKVWETVNHTADPIGNSCLGQKNFCINSTDKCSEKESTCNTNGPNHFLCLCKDGYHGYKCLRNGKFPTIAFFVSTITVTVLLSSFLYWTQRRHVK